MLIKTDTYRYPTLLPSEITPQQIYEGRRDLVKLMATTSAGIALGSWAGREALAQGITRPGKLAALPGARSAAAGAVSMEKLTDYKDASTYNNYYEFGTDKSDPARNAHTLKTQPWSVAVEGLVKSPKTFTLEELLKLSPMEERIYRLRCVEGWSMVIPWVGYSLSALIKKVEPLGSAKYVEFVTLADPKTMPYVGSRVLDWPYTEGLRLDEAMHPLALLAFGMYGEVLPNQNGAPVRMVLPWKYGFKSSKSIVKIRFTDKEPSTAWNKAAAQEYGFYSNVNPLVDHPRWSQATERRIGEDGLFAKKRKTLMFNGYEAQVGQLYAGMDLKELLMISRQTLLLHRAAKPVLFAACLLPFVWLLYGALADQLGANPAEALIRATGDWTLRFVCIALCVTPLRIISHTPALARLRRMLGLFVYFYAVLHLLSYSGFDMAFDVADIARDIAKRPFILVGFTAFVLLTLLAATSFNAAIKALGGKRWQRLHKLVYLIAGLGLLHFFWMRAGKNNFAEVFVYAGIVAVLLGWRVWQRWHAQKFKLSRST